MFYNELYFGYTYDSFGLVLPVVMHEHQEFETDKE